MIGKLNGRVAIVFGAGSGADGVSNGQAAALTYARAGARVAAVDLSEEAVHRTVRSVIDGGGDALAVTADATDSESVASVAAMRDVGYPYPAYMASKAAVNQVTVSLALTHAADGIRANAVAPGFMDTPMVRRQLGSQAGSIDELLANRHAASPTGRMGTCWDVANAALFLASDEAAYVNGVCLPVDGGLTMQCA